MAARAATSTAAKFFPIEVYPVAAPVALAGALFSYMLTRTIVSDPDTRHSVNMPLDCQRTSAYGESWRNTIRGLFDQRIKDGAYTIFANQPAINRV